MLTVMPGIVLSYTVSQCSASKPKPLLDGGDSDYRSGRSVWNATPLHFVSALGLGLSLGFRVFRMFRGPLGDPYNKD